MRREHRKPLPEKAIAIRQDLQKLTGYGRLAFPSVQSPWLPDAIVAELGHVGADEVRRAYHRAAYWEERIKMAEWWATEIDAMRVEVDTHYG